MNDQELDTLLREWGEESKYQRARLEDGGGTNDFHVLQRARDFAPGTRAKAEAKLIGRDGGDRRRYMARELTACGVRAVPMDFVDPIFGGASGGSGGGGGASDGPRHNLPAHLRVVEAASLELYRIDTLRGLVLRQEYCGYGRQDDKAEKVGLAVGSPVGLRIYRESLAMARGWMLAKLSMAAVA